MQIRTGDFKLYRNRILHMRWYHFNDANVYTTSYVLAALQCIYHACSVVGPEFNCILFSHLYPWPAFASLTTCVSSCWSVSFIANQELSAEYLWNPTITPGHAKTRLSEQQLRFIMISHSSLSVAHIIQWTARTSSRWFDLVPALHT